MNSEDKTAIFSAAELAVSVVVVIALVSLVSCCLSRRMMIIPMRLRPGALLISGHADRPIISTTIGSSVAVAAEDRGDVVGQNDAAGGVAKQLEVAGGGACPVCLGEYAANDVVRVLPGCGHVFHRTCVDSWLRLRATCPLCRNEPCVVVSSSRVASLSTVPPPP